MDEKNYWTETFDEEWQSTLSKYTEVVKQVTFSRHLDYFWLVLRFVVTTTNMTS